MKHRLIGPLVLTTLAACSVVLLGDLDVAWRIDGSSSPALCSTYGIDTWHIVADGPERVSVPNIPCSGSWTSGILLFDVEEGYYDVTIEALDSNGTILATRPAASVRVVSGDPPTPVDVDFTASDFGGSGDQVDVFWNINGTEDGTPKGKSWDTCAEVGATQVEVEVNGQVSTHDCHASSNMSAAVTGFTGQPQVRMRLLDTTGSALTTWSPLAAANAGTAANAWWYVGEFYWDSFLTLKDTMIGDYLFQVSYEGHSCTQTSPNVAHQVSLLTLNGTAVSPPPDVCGVDSKCVKADGADFASCYGPDQTQTMADTLWGEYTLKVSGTLSASESYEICWEKEFDIVIGAGKTNPLVRHDLVRLSSTGACTP